MKVIRRSAVVEELTEPLEVIELPDGFVPTSATPRRNNVVNVVSLRRMQPNRKQLRAVALVQLAELRRSSANGGRGHGCSWSRGVSGRY